MKLLVVCPDYASHVEPMLQVASEWQRTIGTCVVATGDAVRPTVERSGVGWTHLRLGRGSNAQVIRAHEQPSGEDAHLREFFAATRRGAMATLRYQALARRQDLLFEPDRITSELAAIIDAVEPDRVLVDHVAFGARVALHALGVEPATIVLGHPTALPAPGERYGLPPEWPACIRPSAAELVELEAICVESENDVLDHANAMLAACAPQVPRLEQLFGRPGNPTMYVYPSMLHDERRPLPEGSVSIGSLRSVASAPTSLPTGGGPLVIVAFGTFLSARADLLRTAVDAARTGGWRLALASGSSPIESLGELPTGSLVLDHLPQVALLEHAQALVTHGGNGSVTEACAAGVPMVVLPMSTDQFANAASIERAGLGIALDPTTVQTEDLCEAVDRVISGGETERAAAVAESVRVDGGAAAAVRAIVESSGHIRSTFSVAVM